MNGCIIYYRIIDIFLQKTKEGRKTGLMTFNKDNEREFEFDLINLQAGRTVKIGEWSNGQLKINRNEQEMNDTLLAAKRKVFKVTTLLVKTTYL